eukprot:1954195-Amphidinium_carterae.1
MSEKPVCGLMRHPVGQPSYAFIFVWGGTHCEGEGNFTTLVRFVSTVKAMSSWALVPQAAVPESRDSAKSQSCQIFGWVLTKGTSFKSNS